MKSKAAELLLGLLTILPLGYMGLFFVGFGFAFMGNGESLPFDFVYFFVVHLGFMFLMFGLITFYVVFLFKTQRVKTELKALWAIVLFMGAPIAMPIFWFLYIWRTEEPANDGISQDAGTSYD